MLRRAAQRCGRAARRGGGEAPHGLLEGELRSQQLERRVEAPIDTHHDALRRQLAGEVGQGRRPAAEPARLLQQLEGAQVDARVAEHRGRDREHRDTPRQPRAAPEVQRGQCDHELGQRHHVHHVVDASRPGHGEQERRREHGREQGEGVAAMGVAVARHERGQHAERDDEASGEDAARRRLHVAERVEAAAGQHQALEVRAVEERLPRLEFFAEAAGASRRAVEHAAGGAEHPRQGREHGQCAEQQPCAAEQRLARALAQLVRQPRRRGQHQRAGRRDQEGRRVDLVRHAQAQQQAAQCDACVAAAPAAPPASARHEYPVPDCFRT